MEDEPDLRERTKDFALRLLRAFRALPKTTDAQVLGEGLLQAGTSVGAILSRVSVDGGSRQNVEMAIAEYDDSLRKLDETAYWLELLVDSKLVAAGKMEALIREREALSAILDRVIEEAGGRNPVGRVPSRGADAGPVPSHSALSSQPDAGSGDPA